jgi:hypothetical protein
MTSLSPPSPVPLPTDRRCALLAGGQQCGGGGHRAVAALADRAAAVALLAAERDHWLLQLPPHPWADALFHRRIQGQRPVREDAAADQEHRRGAGDRRAPSSARARPEDAAPEPRACGRARAGAPRWAQVQAGVVQLDDAGDQAVDADRHQAAMPTSTPPGSEAARRDGAQRDHDDLGRQDEVGADRALDLVLLEARPGRRSGRPAPRQLGAVRRPRSWLCSSLCASFSKPS